MSVRTDSESPVDGGIVEVGYATAEPDANEDGSVSAAGEPKKPGWVPRHTISFGLAIVVVLGILVGWLGFHAHQARQEQVQRNRFLQTAKQGALNLTTIDWQHAESDVHRILDGATGQFYDDFAKRSQPFIEVLKQARVTTVGTITDAGLEPQTADTAQALVAVSVQTSSAVASEQVPRAWRMRVSVQKVGEEIKVANVEFVP